ncbi:MAG: hypothetical protein ND895_12485 [Pyrinomonadaceae bacterium]|nr:hypothetical protein [Pyrinomonadaceae bacterium]
MAEPGYSRNWTGAGGDAGIGETRKVETKRCSAVPQFIAILALTWFGAVTAPGQSSVLEFRNLLRDQAAFTADDFSALERGEMVVKLLPVKDKREVAVCGLMRLRVPLAEGRRAFQLSMSQLNSKAILEIGKFSSPPSPEDLQALTLDDRDLEDLKKCAVGDCKLKMSADMIERFRKEMDWSAPDHRAQATSLFRQMLMDYVKDYLARGDAALIEYHDKSSRVRLEDEHRSLLEASLYINDYSPELTKYLKRFPLAEPTSVENNINWTKIKFGLKPVTIITHVATYTRPAGGVPQILVVSKQLYANHYFDSGLALTALISIPITGTTSDSYLLYTNRSRSDALAGPFSKLKRNLVEGEALTNLNAMMLQTQLNLQPGSIQADSSPRSGKQRLVEWLFGGMRFLWWLMMMMIILLIALFGFRKRNLRRHAASLERDP